MDPAFLQSLRDQRLVMDYSCVTALVIVLYDYTLTLHREISLIWFLPWSYTKILFLLTRYMPIIDTSLVVYNQTYPNLSAGTCAWTVPTAFWLTVLQVIFAELILGVRTWAVWHGDRKVAVFLVSLMVCNTIIQLTYLGRYLESIGYAPPPYPGYRGCFFTRGDPTIIFANCIMLLVFQSSVLVLLLISGLHAYRHGVTSELSKIVYMDGIMFYAYLLCLTFASAMLSLFVRQGLVTLIWPVEDVLYPVLTTRIILKIRKVGRRPDGTKITELHGGYNDGRVPNSTLQFASIF